VSSQLGCGRGELTALGSPNRKRSSDLKQRKAHLIHSVRHVPPRLSRGAVGGRLQHPTGANVRYSFASACGTSGSPGGVPSLRRDLTPDDTGAIAPGCP
jgi:hypothetical protein